MYKIYGIPNCNTVKKALSALEEQGIQSEFINFKKTPPSSAQIQAWKSAFGDWPVNKRGPTYRKIKEEFEAGSAAEKKRVLIENSSAIKRPILERDGEAICFGFDEELYRSLK